MSARREAKRTADAADSAGGAAAGPRVYARRRHRRHDRRRVLDVCCGAGGDLTEVKRLIALAPGLALVEYNYTPPIHFAVPRGAPRNREAAHLRGADLAYRSYPFQDSLLTIAEDHEQEEVAALLRGHITRRFKLRDGVRIIIDAAEASNLNAVHAELSRDLIPGCRCE